MKALQHVLVQGLSLVEPTRIARMAVVWEIRVETKTDVVKATAQLSSNPSRRLQGSIISFIERRRTIHPFSPKSEREYVIK